MKGKGMVSIIKRNSLIRRNVGCHRVPDIECRMCPSCPWFPLTQLTDVSAKRYGQVIYSLYITCDELYTGFSYNNLTPMLLQVYLYIIKCGTTFLPYHIACQRPKFHLDLGASSNFTASQSPTRAWWIQVPRCNLQWGWYHSPLELAGLVSLYTNCHLTSGVTCIHASEAESTTGKRKTPCKLYHKPCNRTNWYYHFENRQRRWSEE